MAHFPYVVHLLKQAYGPALYRCCGRKNIKKLLVVSLLSLSPQQTVAEEAIDYGSFDAHLRTTYFNRDKKENNPDSVAASQALMLRYKSPYLGDVIGVDAGSMAT